jgi:hypothetical protein
MSRATTYLTFTKQGAGESLPRQFEVGEAAWGAYMEVALPPPPAHAPTEDALVCGAWFDYLQNRLQLLVHELGHDEPRVRVRFDAQGFVQQVLITEASEERLVWEREA